MNLVISGGQTGADQAALRAAKACGLETGGWIPKMFVTEEGYRPELGTTYGLQETEEAEYPFRTEANVRDCTGCIWFGQQTTPGDKLTIRLVQNANKPLLILPTNSNGFGINSILWLQQNILNQPNPVLMIAGNRESTHPGTGEWVERYLSGMFNTLKGMNVTASGEKT